MNQRFVEVALPPPLPRELTYAVPAEYADDVYPGTVVLVPVQKRLVTGFIIDDTTPPASLDLKKIRNIKQIIDAESPLTPEIVNLCRWMARYYVAPIGAALAAALPPGVKLSTQRRVQLTRVDKDVHGKSIGESKDKLKVRILEQLQTNGTLKVTTLQRRLGRIGLEKVLQQMKRSGSIDILPVLEDAEVSVRLEQHLRITDPNNIAEKLPALTQRAPRQASCLRYILKHGTPLKKTVVDRGFGYGIIRGLVSRGLIETVEEERIRDPLAHLDVGPNHPLHPTDDQKTVLVPIIEALNERVFFPALLQGVTGSGKTLVYIQSAERALEQGRSTIVLVPEIALAWQMVRRFKAHFRDKVAVLHSQLSKGERYDTWRQLRRGKQRLVIGARSAILAPVTDLGLIVVDEEHDTSYNQDDRENTHAIAYSARDLALVRGRLSKAVVLLGSATPSLESFWNAQTGKYQSLSLPRRVDDRPLPKIEIVDMRKEPFQRRERTLFSLKLRKKIQDRLEKKERIILLQNRRGFAPVIQCSDCGESVQCLRCHVCLTLHRGQPNQLLCHYCGYSQPEPESCSQCGNVNIRKVGIGTQQVENALLEQFPGIRVIRMDVDTTGWKGAHDELVERFRAGEADVLLGTQMVAKGLDFPEVTLVGVISADTGLHMPDFRAAERSFQLLTQVAGRSGRGDHPGEVVVQTRLPEELALQAAARQNFTSFAEQELAERRESGFPPFGRLIMVRWWSQEQGKVEIVAQQATNLLMQSRPQMNTTVLGPAPAPLALLRGQHRWQALLVGPSAGSLREWAVKAIGQMRQIATASGVNMTLIVDPQNTM